MCRTIHLLYEADQEMLDKHGGDPVIGRSTFLSNCE
eukprot:gene17507-23094_t